MLENGAREFAPRLVCPNRTYSSAGRVSMSTHRDARGGAASARRFLGELVAVGASIAHKWSLTTISSPLHPLFQIQLWKSWHPNWTLSAAEMFLWQLAFCTVCERTWPPCFSLFLNPPNVILAVPITPYRSPVLPWILLSTWPQWYLWRGPFTSSHAAYSMSFLCVFKCLVLRVHSWSHSETAPINITGYKRYRLVSLQSLGWAHSLIFFSSTALWCFRCLPFLGGFPSKSSFVVHRHCLSAASAPLPAAQSLKWARHSKLTIKIS